ncbi:MAG: Ig-like domain-containing protein, partial [Bacteroidetes bacterium]|nr:Ig-like domain-containing protein [Bacteroidota bacterium]
MSLILIISLFSCKKGTDEKGPIITFNTPTVNQTFNVNDYVTVNATVTDDTKITSVSVSLLDANEHLAHLTIPVSVSSPTMTLNMQYFLDNVHLLSGIYNIEISAS